MINNTITTPIIHDLHIREKCGNAILLDSNHTIAIHKTVEQLAYYFKREGNFGFAQYSALEDRRIKKCNAFIWVDSDWEGDFVVGTILFRFLDDTHQNKKWSAQWAWIHPYYRNRGLLSEAWPEFIKKYGDFTLEYPLSKSMENFLTKLKHPFIKS